MNYVLFILSLYFTSIEALMISDSEPVYPMMCELYNEKNCSSPSGCEFQVEMCESDTSCYTVWSTTGDVKMKGCFPDNQECYQRDCIANSPSPNGLLFCCCNEPLCNEDHAWIPLTKEEVLEKIIEEVEDDLMFYILVLGVVPFIFIISLVIMVSFVIYKKRSKECDHIDISTIESATHRSSLFSVQLIDVKAKGKYGTVWLGTICDEKVAVKISEDEESWKNESDIYNLRSMNHPNILEFLTSEAKSKKEFWIISSYHNNGSLSDYLKNNILSWKDFCKIAESMATGLTFLHEEKNDGLKPSIAHRDFKSQNVILKDDLTACIADFGLAMLFKCGSSCEQDHSQVGTKRYMAPEVIEGAIDFNRDAFLRIDIYACGLVLWEMVSRCNAHNLPSNNYYLPFELELGSNPSLQNLHETVVKHRMRPKILENWRAHEVRKSPLI
ncbi:ACVR2A.2 family protein [Megaselia abdita]